jgi:hypothetical protein
MKDELLMEIKVTCYEPAAVEGKHQKIVMIPFGGEASGEFFHGKVIGTGVDTQKIDPDGKVVLSARYMLEGTDAAGNACRIFVENQGGRDTGLTPYIVTDSPLLSGWEDADLYATAEDIPEGVMIRILKRSN